MFVWKYSKFKLKSKILDLYFALITPVLEYHYFFLLLLLDVLQYSLFCRNVCFTCYPTNLINRLIPRRIS